MLFIKTIIHIYFATFVQIYDNLASTYSQGHFYKPKTILAIQHQLKVTLMVNNLSKKSNWFNSFNFIIVT